MPRKCVIHIGGNKAASTTLQRHLFTRHSGLHYVGEDAAGYDEYSTVVNSLINDDDLYFCDEKASRLFDEQLRADPGKTFVYSSEDIMTSRVPSMCARRLRDLLPDAHVLLIIRNQFTAIPSFYANHGAYLKPAPPRYFRKFVEFDDWMSYCMMFMPYSPLGCFRYDRFVTLFGNLFGREKVHILMFEDFLKDKPAFMRRLSEILDIDPDEAIKLVGDGQERKRSTRRMLRYHRLRSRFFWRVSLSRTIPGGQMLRRAWHNYLAGGAGAANLLTDGWREKITGIYGPGNAALAREFGLPMREYGYPMADNDA